MSSKINKDNEDFLTYDFKLNETLELLGITISKLEKHLEN